MSPGKSPSPSPWQTPTWQTYKMAFLKSSCNRRKAIYTHWYPRPNDLKDPCGHHDLPDG